MRISESRIRRIIRQEIVRALDEQTNFQATGATVDAAVTGYAATLDAKLTPAELTEVSTAVVDFIIKSNSVFRLLASVPGTRETIIKTLEGALSTRQLGISKIRAAGAAASAGPGGGKGVLVTGIVLTLGQMQAQGQIQGIIQRMLSQGKGFAEITGAIADEVAKRSSAM